MNNKTANTAADQQAVNVIRGLIMDTVSTANSGHPGGAMSSADFAYILFREFLKFDPQNPNWANRDRFVLSAGHESALLYALLTMRGWLETDDLRQFRQLGSKTPGHPEYGVTPGVEATTGPLGQGLAMAGGMAVAECFLRQHLNGLIDHFTYVLATDGDLQEPIAMGSAALCGKWKLGRLIVFYDSNSIQLAGPTSLADTTDYATVFSGMGWHVQEIDGHNHAAIRAALQAAQQETQKPSLLIGRTIMAKGSASLENNCASHGAPFSEDEIRASKKKMGLPETDFFLPEETVNHFQANFADLAQAASKWEDHLQQKQQTEPEFAPKWAQAFEEPAKRKIDWPQFEHGTSMATRKAFGQCLNALARQMPTLIGGSADLDPSNQTAKFRDTYGCFSADNPQGRNLCFGVREFPMAAMLNGMALHGGVVPFGATFLVFSDYERNAIRMSALQGLPVLHIFTHDSFYVGEDGPTHQPVEHVSSLRLIPNLLVFRPADANESARCMDIALQQTNRPSLFCFTRQGLPVLDTTDKQPEKGAYIVRDCNGQPDIILLASGSEVHLALEAACLLPEKKIRVISVPCMELFDEQPAEYKEALLPNTVRARMALEAGASDLWAKYVGLDGYCFGLNDFGDSAPAKTLCEKYGFTAQNIVRLIQEKF